MIRPLAIAVAALLLAVPRAQAAPELRPAVTVDAPVIRLGDLFTDAGSHARDPVAAAPAAGMRTTFSAEWLAAVARGHQLPWTPRSPYDQTTVVRATRAVGPDTIARQLMAAIVKAEPVGKAELRLDNPDLQLFVPANAPEQLAIDELDLDGQSGRFSAFVSAQGGDPGSSRRQRVTGRLIYQLDVPELAHALSPGQTIVAADLVMAKVRRDRVAPDVISNANQLIGMTPYRPLGAGEPLRLGDVERPVLVHKGDLVTIVLRTASLQLTAQGKALDDGAFNALVRVENAKSHRVIDTAVTGPGLVAVRIPGNGAVPTLAALR